MPQLLDRTGDPTIPTLAAVLDPTELAKQLSLPSFSQWGWNTSQVVRPRVLRWKRGVQCTFEITLQTANGWHELIGKVCAEDRSDVYRTMQEIRQGGFGAEEEFAIPRPVAFLAPLRLLLYEKVPGVQAQEFILNPNESDRVLAAKRCARWLARFQAIGPRSGRVFRLDDHLISLERWCRRLADLGWPFADKARRLFERLKTAAVGLGSIEMCPGHGDYTCSQVILSEGRTVTVDWDSYDVGDPCRDVARFLVALQRLGLKRLGLINALDEAAEVFLDTYIATCRLDISRRLPFHKAAICLERADHDIDKQSRGLSDRADVMLEEGLRVLKQELN